VFTSLEESVVLGGRTTAVDFSWTMDHSTLNFRKQ